MTRSTITPHASHRWGLVSGERRCKVCYAAPDWAIAEDECGSQARCCKTNTEARDVAIAAAYERGDKLRDMRESLGVSTWTIHQVVNARCVRRRADRPKLPPITMEQAATAQQRINAGHALTVIAADLGVDYKRLLRRLQDVQRAEQKRLDGRTPDGIYT